MRLYKCKGRCGDKFNIDEMRIISDKKYCIDCHKEITKEREERDNLYKYICELFEIEQVTGLILKQVKQYKTEFNYSNSGITYTLWYIKEIEGKTFSETKYGIALVKYYYEKAKSYFEQQQRITNSVTHKESKIKEIRLNLDKVYDNKNKFTIDLNELLGGG